MDSQRLAFRDSRLWSLRVRLEFKIPSHHRECLGARRVIVSENSTINAVSCAEFFSESFSETRSNFIKKGRTYGDAISFAERSDLRRCHQFCHDYSRTSCFSIIQDPFSKVLMDHVLNCSHLGIRGHGITVRWGQIGALKRLNFS